MCSGGKPNGSDLSIVTLVLQCGVFPSIVDISIKKDDYLNRESTELFYGHL